MFECSKQQISIRLHSDAAFLPLRFSFLSISHKTREFYPKPSSYLSSRWLRDLTPKVLNMTYIHFILIFEVEMIQHSVLTNWERVSSKKIRKVTSAQNSIASFFVLSSSTATNESVFVIGVGNRGEKAFFSPTLLPVAPLSAQVMCFILPRPETQGSPAADIQDRYSLP